MDSLSRELYLKRKREDIRAYFPKRTRMMSDAMFIPYGTRRAYTGRGRNARATRRAIGIPRSIIQRVHAFKRMGQIITLGSGGSGSVEVNGSTSFPQLGTSLSGVVGGDVIGTQEFGCGMNFALNYISNVSEITSLFENYRIKMVKLRFDFSYNTAPGATTSAQIAPAVPRVHFAPDLDDSQAPGNQGIVLENAYCKTARLDKPFFITIKPRFQNGVATNSGVTPNIVAGGQGSRSSWLDSGSPSIEHYGLKLFFLDMPTGGKVNTQYQWTLTCTPTYFVETKNVA